MEEVLLLYQDLCHNVGCECWNDRSPRHRSRSAKDSCHHHPFLDTRTPQRISYWLRFYISASLGNVREPDSAALHFHISCCSYIAPLLEWFKDDMKISFWKTALEHLLLGGVELSEKYFNLRYLMDGEASTRARKVNPTSTTSNFELLLPSLFLKLRR